MALVRILAFAVGALGCATTSGSTWVSQPEPGPFANDEISLAASERTLDTLDVSPASRLVSELERDGARSPRPRLDRTVTLGEVVAAERAYPAPGAGRAPVTVVINNTVNVSSNGAGYYPSPVLASDFRPAEDGAARRARPAARPAAARTRPGQNWPAIPNHGTSFPFKTAPASPWR